MAPQPPHCVSIVLSYDDVRRCFSAQLIIILLMADFHAALRYVADALAHEAQYQLLLGLFDLSRWLPLASYRL